VLGELIAQLDRPGGTTVAPAAAILRPANADILPLGALPYWRYPDPRVEVLDKRSRPGSACGSSGPFNRSSHHPLPGQALRHKLQFIFTRPCWPNTP
jgi:hypothetical protein